MANITIRDLDRAFKLSNRSDNRSKRELFNCFALLIEHQLLNPKIAKQWLQKQLGKENILFNLEYYKTANIKISIKSKIDYLKQTKSIDYILGNFSNSDIIMILLRCENPKLVFDAIGIENILQTHNWDECYFAFKNNANIHEDAAIIFLAQTIAYFRQSNDIQNFKKIARKIEKKIGLDLENFDKVMQLIAQEHWFS